MPRDEARDFTSDERERNQLSAFGRLQNSGLRRGPGGRGGRATGRVGETPQGSNAAVQIEHVTLQAVAGQTIAAGGGTVLFDRIAAAPTERRGFRKAAAAIAADGSVGAIAFDVTGQAILGIELEFEAEVTATVTLVRTRGHVTTELASREGTGDRFDWFPHLAIRAGDTIDVVLDHATSGTTYSSATTIYSSSSVTYSSGGAFLAWGRVQATAWTEASPTTPVTSVTFVDATTDIHLATASPSVAAPTSVQGDLIVAVIRSVNAPPSSVTPPSGFTQFGSAFGACRVWTKVATDSEPATYDFTSSSSADHFLAIHVYRGALAVVEVEADSQNPTSGDMATAAGTEIGAALVAMRFHDVGGGGTAGTEPTAEPTPDLGWTQRHAQESRLRGWSAQATSIPALTWPNDTGVTYYGEVLAILLSKAA